MTAPPARDLARYIRSVPDFPKPGIVFRDITTLLQDGEAFAATVSLLVDRARAVRPDVIVGIESRGFIFGAPVAHQLGIGFAPVRKEGKLPAATTSETYALEYGEDTIEMHTDALTRGARAVLVDDLLATGGTAAAACRLVERLGAQVVLASFVIELAFLPGRERLAPRPVDALIRYDSE